jgi:putative transposase
VIAHATTLSVQRKIKRTPPRLELIFARYDPPLFFVTFNVHRRRRILASRTVHTGFQDYARRAAEFQICVGRYVIMPDHVHLLVCFGRDCPRSLGEWIKGLKKCLGSALRSSGIKATSRAGQQLRSFWQPGFHDHLLRSDESYDEKWNYVRENPVRAGLVARADDWPYAGEIVYIDRV